MKVYDFGAAAGPLFPANAYDFGLGDPVEPPSSDALATIGALTLPNAGARTVTGATDGTYQTYWVISSGVLKRNATAGTPTPGTFDAGSVTITVEAGVYDVISKAELEAVIALGHGTISGKTIACLGDVGGTSIGDTVNFPETLALTDVLTITSRDPEDPARLRRVTDEHTGPMRLHNMIIRDFWKPGDYPHTSIWDAGVDEGGTNSTTFDCCETYSDTVTTASTSPSPGTVVEVGQYYRIKSVVSTDWTSVGRATPAVVDGDFMCTSASADISALGTVVPYPRTLRAFDAQHHETATTTFIMRDSTIHDCGYAVAGSYTHFTFERNSMPGHLSDCIQLSPNKTDATILIKDNYFPGPRIAAGNPYGTHVDFVQLNLIKMPGPNTEPWVFQGNRFCDGGTDTSPAQGNFFENSPVAEPAITYIVTDNLFLTGAANGITLEAPSEDSHVARNTLAFNQSKVAIGFEPKITIADEKGAVLIEENTHCGMSLTGEVLTAAAARHNYQYVTNDNAGMDDVLAGTDFSGATLTTLASLTAALLGRTGSAVDTPHGRKIGAGWYYEWDGSVPALSKSGLVSGTLTLPADIVPDAFGTDDWTLTDAGSGDGLHVTINNLPLDGGDPITDIEYRVDGGTAVSTGGVDSFDIPLDELTIDVEADVEARPVNSVGPGAWSAVKSATPTNIYVINAIALESVEYLSRTTDGLGIAASKKGIMRMHFYHDDSVPTSGATFTMRNAGTSDRARVNNSSSGRLNLGLIDGSGTTIHSLNSSTNAILTGEWYSVAVAWDTTTGVRKARIYVRPSSTGTWSSVLSNNALTADAEIGAIERYAISPNSHQLQYLADYVCIIGAYIDLDTPANRNLFLPSTDPADLEAAVGVSAQVKHTGSTGSWHLNSGTGPDPTLTGTLSTAPSVPT